MPDSSPQIEALLDGYRRHIAELTAALQTANRRIEHLANEIMRLKRLGVRPFDEAGQELFEFGEGGAAFVAVPRPSGAEPDPARDRHGRRRLPKNLPRERIEYHPAPAERVCACGCAKTRIGEELSEQLDYTPSVLKVIEHARIKYACPKCREGVVVGPLPEKVYDKGLPGEGLLAAVLVNKYEDHLPLYRQQMNIFKRHGLEIPRSTQCQWVAFAAGLLEPIYRCIAAEVPKSRKIHTDDTTLPLLDPRIGRARAARLWVYLGDDEHRHAYYEFTARGGRDGPAGYLKEYAGYLQADAYGGYDGLYAGKRIVEVACWAHARRKFDEALSTDARSAQALSLIKTLYEVEGQARDLPSEGRRILRQSLAVPVLARFKAWLDATVVDALPKSPLGQAARYCQAQWDALTRYTTDGILEADNNAAERALRAVAIGRKNWLFCATESGARRAAILYTLVYGCKLNGHDVWTYLKDVLVRVGKHPASRILELTPMHWKPAVAPETTQAVPAATPVVAPVAAPPAPIPP